MDRTQLCGGWNPRSSRGKGIGWGSLKIKIKRFKNNPLIEPNPNFPWMAKNAFNPGVIIDDDGLWKMLIRGAKTENQWKSDLGLALSLDGISWSWIISDPVLKCGCNRFCPLGIDDPRVVKWIDGYKYIFAAIRTPDGKYRRIGIWKTKNFFEYKWVGIPFDENDIDASIFPKPINGWVYYIHRKFPHIWISRTKDMSLKSGWQDSQILTKTEDWYKDPFEKVLPLKIGLAGPPIKIPKGWLVITHVCHSWDKRKSKYSYLINRRYSLGFMVLDLENPRKILYLHPEPILIPEKRYEISGAVPNVVFSCAAVDLGENSDSIYVYWGGADTVICGGKLKKKDLKICY